METNFVVKFVDKLRNSRDFTISLLIHVVFVAIFGTTVLFQAVQEPPDFEGGSEGFVGSTEENAPPPETTPQEMPPTQDVSVTATPVNNSPVSAITTTATAPSSFSMAQMVMAPVPTAAPAASTMSAPKPSAPVGGVKGTGMTAAAAAGIKGFTGGWGKGSGSGTGTRSREFEFTAYIGQYDGGDWASSISTVKRKAPGQGVEPDNIDNGSLPNLLAYISEFSGGKIKTNYKNVKTIKLSSPDFFSLKPPFIFMTGSRDFVLTEPEVENLRKYVSLGGAIWGDSTRPGRNSRFDIAFRREMKRVLPDKDKEWEELPTSHPIFTGHAYYPEVKDVPAGINFYKEPVYCLKIYGEIAVIYTANDYGDMWQFALDTDRKKLYLESQNPSAPYPHSPYLAQNPVLMSQRGRLIFNVEPPALDLSFKFGVNMIIHLLTRWESKTKSATSL